MRKAFRSKSVRLIPVVGSPLILLMALLAVLNVKLTPVYADPGIIYVDGDAGSDSDTCGSLASPCCTISCAVASRASAGDTVFVMPGTYTETISMQPSVVISGSGAATTIIDGNGSGPVVSAGSGITNSAVLRGFTVRRGSATDGGGLSITDGASPVIEDCIVRDNSAASRGGGIFIDSATPVIRNTIVRDNDQASTSSYTYGGAGIYVRSCSPTISNTQVISNTANRYGGGIYIINTGADPVLEGVDVLSNTAQRGGGICIYNSASPTINGGEVSGNQATGTSTDDGGGGLYIRDSSPSIINTQIVGNTAERRGSGIYVSRAFPRLLHSTIACNSGGDGHGLYVTNVDSNYSAAALTNTILVSQTTGIYVNSGNTATLESTLWSGNTTNWSGTVNRTNDYFGAPTFVDPEGGDYHIGVGSAAIDVGVNAGVSADIDGESRDALPDLGADEFRTCWVRLNDDPTDYTSVQAAVGASTQPTDVVKVAGYCTGVEGRAAPSGYIGASTITQVVYVSKTMTVQGGYTTTDWSTPDPDNNPTTLDAQGQGRVLFIVGDISPTVEGLRITDGSAAGLGGNVGGENGGGGVYVFTATATISNVWVFGNDAPDAEPESEGEGGGMFVISATATVKNSWVFSNTATYGGGVSLQCDASSFVGNTIMSNTTPGPTGQSAGGGLTLNKSHATLADNTIVANYSGSGGGVFLKNSSVALVNNVIANNQTWALGGGLYLESSDATLDGNSIISNTSSAGGGLYLWNSNPTLVNNVIANNQASAYGGGLYIYRSSPHLLHTTIVQNGGGDGVHVERLSSVTFDRTFTIA
jgi:hypothetical protein